MFFSNGTCLYSAHCTDARRQAEGGLQINKKIGFSADEAKSLAGKGDRLHGPCMFRVIGPQRCTGVMIHRGPGLNPTGPGFSRIRPVSR